MRPIRFFLLALALSTSCDAPRDVDTELSAVRAEWSSRLTALRARQAEHEARVRETRSLTAPDSVAAQVNARRLEVIGIRAQQALTEGDRLVDEIVNDVNASKDRQEALLQGRVRMAEYLAAQEEALTEAQIQLARRAEGENR